jgi:amino acid transporter
LINIGSGEVLTIVFSLANSSLITSYFITIGSILLRRLQGHKLPPSRYSLGKWGVWINAASLIYLIPVYIFSFFPPSPNPTTATMNWGCVMYGGVIIFSTIYYVLWGRKTFMPPKDTIEDYLNEKDGVYEQPENDGSEKDTGIVLETQEQLKEV